MNTTNLNNNIEISFDDLFLEYYDAIFRFCYHKLNNKSEAEDITSEIFTILFSIWTTFSPKTRPVLVSWLYKTAQNKVYNHSVHWGVWVMCSRNKKFIKRRRIWKFCLTTY